MKNWGKCNGVDEERCRFHHRSHSFVFVWYAEIFPSNLTLLFVPLRRTKTLQILWYKRSRHWISLDCQQSFIVNRVLSSVYCMNEWHSFSVINFMIVSMMRHNFVYIIRSYLMCYNSWFCCLSILITIKIVWWHTSSINHLLYRISISWLCIQNIVPSTINRTKSKWIAFNRTALSVTCAYRDCVAQSHVHQSPKRSTWLSNPINYTQIVPNYPIFLSCVIWSM